MRISLIVGLLFLLCPMHAIRAEEEATQATPVGMVGRLDGVVLPGPELDVKPLTDPATPVVLRIVAAYPHGDSFRYDLEYYGLEPGEYNLADYLETKDGAGGVSLPPIPAKVQASLPPGQIEPNSPSATAIPRVGGYRLMLWVLGICWGMTLLAVIFYRKKRERVSGLIEQRELSFEERLKPLVEAASRGDLNEAGRAQLERMLFDYWRNHLDLKSSDPLSTMRELKAHPEAGVLLLRVEEWLHRPGGKIERDEISDLLKPYRDLPEGESDKAVFAKAG